MNFKEALRDQGYFVIKQAFNPEEVKYFRNALEKKSGVTSEKFHTAKGKKRRKINGVMDYRLFAKQDGVAQNKEFWPVLFNEKILAAVRQALGSDQIRFLQHNDISAGFSASSWHRDSVFRTFGKGPDWVESEEPYRMVRIGIYFQTFAESNFRLGVIPFSHKKQGKLLTLERKYSNKLKFKSLLFGQRMLSAKNVWHASELGDALIFDPRLLHNGSYITGPKYAIFIGYGLENSHFTNYVDYYRNKRKELGYEPISQELADLLEKHNLLPKTIDLTKPIPELPLTKYHSIRK